ncbi:MAG: hypothetical protein AB1422_08740 [bacterium]
MYCYNNPINWIDPFGLCPEEPGLESTWDELMLIPGLGLVGKVGKGAKFLEKAEALISGYLKRSKSYHSEYAKKTYQEIIELAKKGDKKAQQMKKLIQERKRLLKKRKK